MPAILALLLLTAFPSTNRTAWMRPDAFHLTVGMPRAEAMKALEKWAPKKGKTPDELIVDYSEDKSLTLEFHKGRLTSIRFELFVYLNASRLTFDEEKKYLADSLGAPRVATNAVLIYDTALPNVMVVITDDPKSEQAKKGLAVLAVRYYDPRV